MTEDKGKDASELLQLAVRNHRFSAIILFFLFVLAITVVFVRCGAESKKIIVDENTPRVGACTDGLKVGDTKRELCPNGDPGERILVCKSADISPEIVVNTCLNSDACLKTTFNDHVKPIVESECIGCHGPAKFNDYNVAVIRIDEWIRRIDLGADQSQRMPPEKELSPDQKRIFHNWREDGMYLDARDCLERGGGLSRRPSLGYLESTALIDASKVDSDDRFFIRWISALHKKGQELEVAKKAIEKTLNSLVSKSRRVTRITEVDPRGLWRIDLRSFEMDRNDWEDIEGTEPLDLVSNTDKGRVLRLLTSSRKPWLHYENFIDTVLFNSELYYDLVGIQSFKKKGERKTGSDFLELTDRLGVDFEGDFRNYEAALVGFNNSPISLTKNRLMSRHRSDDGYFWASYDVDNKNRNRREANLYAFPFPFEVGSRRVFEHDAGEVIFSLPNGFQAYALFDANGVLQNFAPTTIVQDNLNTRVAPYAEITNAISCFRCHHAGIIPAKDEVRAKVLASAREFEVKDIERAENLYKPQTSLDALYRIDNKLHADALAKIGILPSEPDPINLARDTYRYNWDARQLAEFLLISEEKLKEYIRRSGEAQEAVGQLLSGGTITFDQLVDIMPVFIRDFRFLEEPINGGG